MGQPFPIPTKREPSLLDTLLLLCIFVNIILHGYCIQGRNYSMEELQMMLMDMAQGFGPFTWDEGPSIFDDPRPPKRAPCDSYTTKHRSSFPHLNVSGWGTYGAS